jgi:hypothetical protein
MKRNIPKPSEPGNRVKKAKESVNRESPPQEKPCESNGGNTKDIAIGFATIHKHDTSDDEL